MLQLFNLSTYEEDLQVFGRDSKSLLRFLNEHGLDGLELLIDQPWEETMIPRAVVTGVHLRYWSNWLDFWVGNRDSLQIQFGSEDNVVKYYGGVNRYALVDKYREELDKAIATGAEYAVFHVSNARLNELFTYDFAYNDEQVIDGTIELVNAITEGLNSNIKILFENLWWPGLTLTNKKLAARLLEKTNYPHKGFMLDTGHLMNTNHSLQTQLEGIEYVVEVVKRLGELKSSIYGIHLHYSLSGRYILQHLNRSASSFDKDNIMSHILKIDQHLPFTDSAIERIVNYIQPKYLIHEFMFSSYRELSEAIRTQQAALSDNMFRRGDIRWSS